MLAAFFCCLPAYLPACQPQTAAAAEHHSPAKLAAHAHEKGLIILRVVHTDCPVHNCLDKLPSPCAFPVPDKIASGNGPRCRVVEIDLHLEAVWRLSEGCRGLQSLPSRIDWVTVRHFNIWDRGTHVGKEARRAGKMHSRRDPLRTPNGRVDGGKTMMMLDAPKV
jgi:hypothetical protein